MFPEYRDLISKLRSEDAHFARLFDEHNELDHQIVRLEKNPATANNEEIGILKRQKLQLKDRLYLLLKEATSS